MNKVVFILSFLILVVSSNSYSQFGIEKRIRDKYKKEGKKHADKQLEKAEDKGMEQAEKGVDKAVEAVDPQLEKAEENKEVGEEYVGKGLDKYQEFVDNYDETISSKNPEDYRRYSFNSAAVVYRIDDSDDKSKEVFIEDGGYKYAEYEYETKRKKTDKKGQILIGSKMISLDFEHYTAVEMNNPLAYLLANPDRNWEESSKRILEKMGYEIIGHETILGRNCEIWKQGAHKMWVWNGLTLKSKMGRSTEIATEIKINEGVAEKKFLVPDGFEFTVLDEKSLFPDLSEANWEEDEMTPEEWNQMLDKVETMSWSEFKAMVLKEDPDVDIEQLKQSYLYLRQEAKRRHKE